MHRIILRYGLISTLILMGITVVVLLALGVPGPEDYAMGEIIGYSSIIVSLIPVFFGIKYYRDEIGGGSLSFWKGIGVGLAIATIPSLAFAIYNLIYVKWIDPEFSEKYLQYTLDSARAEMTAAEFEGYAAQLEAQSATFTDPLVMTVLMFLTVFLVGFVIAIISALILRRTHTESATARVQ